MKKTNLFSGIFLLSKYDIKSNEDIENVNEIKM